MDTWGFIILFSFYTFYSAAAAAAKSLQLCPTLCDPIDGSPPGSPVPGILQARTLEWAAISFSNAWKRKSESEVAQSCPTLGDPMDWSPPGSSVHGIFQARVLERGAITFSDILFYISLNEKTNRKNTIKNRDQAVSCLPKDGYDIRAVPNRQEGKALLVFGGGDWKTGEQGKSAEDYSALFLGWKS